MRILLLIGTLFLLSCGKKGRVPQEIIQVPKMTEILWDLMIADELVAYRYPGDLAKRGDSATALYSQVAAAHRITNEQIKKSIRYYEGRPDLLQVIFDTLNKRATQVVPFRKDSAQVQ